MSLAKRGPNAVLFCGKSDYQYPSFDLSVLVYLSSRTNWRHCVSVPIFVK